MRPAVPCVLTVRHSGARWAGMLCWRREVYAHGAATSLGFLRGTEGIDLRPNLILSRASFVDV